MLIAAGFLGSQPYVTDAFQVELDPRTNVHTEPGAYQTSVPGVFTCGDMHRGPVSGGVGPSRREERPRRRWITT